MECTIMRLAIAGVVAAALGSPAPVAAQQSATGVDPVFFQGDATPEQIAEICGIPFDEDRVVVLSPTSFPSLPGDFQVDGSLTGETLSFTDISALSQSNGTPGLEAAAVRRNSTNIYCYPTRIADSELDAPGNGSPNQVTFIWGPGPCLLDETQVGTVCSAYNPSDDPDDLGRTADFVHAQEIHPEPGQSNVCGCPPVQVQNCDPTQPAGGPVDDDPLTPPPNPDSCNPTGEGLAGAPQGHTLAQTGTTSHIVYCPSRGTFALAGTLGTSSCLTTTIGH